MGTRRSARPLLAVLALAACEEEGTAPQAQVERFTVTLNAAQEVPAPTGNVASATGTATFTLNPGTSNSTTTMSFTLTAAGLTSPVTGAHIHAPAAAGATANFVVNLIATAAVQNSALPGTISGTITAVHLTGAANTIDGPAAGALAAFMRSKQAYVNVHTVTNTNGEIRGNF